MHQYLAFLLLQNLFLLIRKDYIWKALAANLTLLKESQEAITYQKWKYHITIAMERPNRCFGQWMKIVANSTQAVPVKLVL